MGDTQGYEWSPELAQTIEGLLTTILNSIPGVQNIKGSSSQGFGDFKVSFVYRYGPMGVVGCYMQLAPDGSFYEKGTPLLAGWTSGVAQWPPALTEALKVLFTECHYTTKDADSIGEPWHLWLYIGVQDLHRVAESLSSKPQ